MNQLTVLDPGGDTPITWDDNDPQAREEARRIVADLKAKGYIFFLVDGTPADEITAGKGTLLVRRLPAEEVITPVEVTEVRVTEPVEATGPKRRGRRTVATRPLTGG